MSWDIAQQGGSGKGPFPNQSTASPGLAQLYSLDAEQAVLGAILWDNEASEMVGALDAGAFYDPTHGRIWEEMQARLRAGRLVDAVTMREWAVASEALREIGGASYLLVLLQNAARLKTHVRDYTRVVRDLAGKRELMRLLGEAQDLILSGETSVYDVIGQHEMALRRLNFGDERTGKSLYEAGEALAAQLSMPDVGIKTGFTEIDKRLGSLFPQELIIIAGRPAMGKTSLATNLAENMARAGKCGHFASYEMSAESIAARRISAADWYERGDNFREGAMPYAKLRRGGEEIDRTRVDKLREALPRNVYVDDCPAQNIPQLDASVRATRRRYGRIDFVIVDYLQLMTGTTRSSNRVEVVTEISQGLKALAKYYKVPVIALSQLSRANEARDDKRPQLSDLRESGSIEQDADVVMMVYREAYYLSRDEPKPDQFRPSADKSAQTAFEEAYNAWEAQLRQCERRMEVSTAKQRNGPVGTDVVLFIDKHDVAKDWPK